MLLPAYFSISVCVCVCAFTRIESALFVSELCNSEGSLKMFVACGGVNMLVSVLSHEYYDNRKLVFLGLECIDKVFLIKVCLCMCVSVYVCLCV